MMNMKMNKIFIITTKQKDYNATIHNAMTVLKHCMKMNSIPFIPILNFMGVDEDSKKVIVMCKQAIDDADAVIYFRDSIDEELSDVMKLYYEYAKQIKKKIYFERVNKNE